ncbi:hypothetical protein HYFRA_00005192 [Hymenoscyphus fraxineus]|uniref:2EXR domain-containing protein n=1 Tax=Hymenoscyphus fraxineus TaxID=746836 RepID=A0A9N9LBU6_9HELO|nr:hypothetical protein HYFRA_00005192 [Hymenoscyphus fraxineus]
MHQNQPLSNNSRQVSRAMKLPKSWTAALLRKARPILMKLGLKVCQLPSSNGLDSQLLPSNGLDTSTFTFFPKLPSELRLAIWDFAAFVEPRVVEFSSQLITPDDEPACIGYIFSRTPLPSILSICHESREVALRYYITSFYGRRDIFIRYNPAIDTILFGYLRSYAVELNWFSMIEGHEHVRHIAYACRSYEHWQHAPYSSDIGTRLECLARFPHLETFCHIWYDRRPGLEGFPRSHPFRMDRACWFHTTQGFRRNGHLQLDHVLSLEDLERHNAGIEGNEAFARARESYENFEYVSSFMPMLSGILEGQEKKTPGFKKPALRAAHLTIDGLPYCHSYKKTVREQGINLGGAGT